MECMKLGLVASVLVLVLIILMGSGESMKVEKKVKIYGELVGGCRLCVSASRQLG